MARWEEALDGLLDFYLYANSERGRRYASNWAASFGYDKHHIGLFDNLDTRLVTYGFNTEPFWVDPDMQTLWEAATPSFEPEPLMPQDLLTPSGFVWLPRPFNWTDIHQRRTTFRAFGWYETTMNYMAAPNPLEVNGKPERVRGPGIVLMSFHRVGDIDDYDGGYGMKFPELDDPAWVGDGLLDKAELEVRAGQRDKNGIVPYKFMAPNLRTGDLQIDHIMPWVYGATYGDRYDTGEVAYRSNPLNVQKFAQCLWRLMQQTIATRAEAEPRGPFKRRWEREKLDARKVTVVKLRRPRRDPDPDAEPTEVEWDHRWLVSGHWRSQWYPSLSAHRQIWISPYVKGPEDAPLEIRKTRVFEFVQ